MLMYFLKNPNQNQKQELLAARRREGRRKITAKSVLQAEQWLVTWERELCPSSKVLPLLIRLSDDLQKVTCQGRSSSTVGENPILSQMRRKCRQSVCTRNYTYLWSDFGKNCKTEAWECQHFSWINLKKKSNCFVNNAYENYVWNTYLVLRELKSTLNPDFYPLILHSNEQVTSLLSDRSEVTMSDLILSAICLFLWQESYLIMQQVSWKYSQCEKFLMISPSALSTKNIDISFTVIIVYR